MNKFHGDSIDDMKNGEYWPISNANAKRICKKYKVRLPKVGHEICLDHELRLWITECNHPQFGSFGRTQKHNFEVRRY